MADSVNPQAATVVRNLTSKKANAIATLAFLSETHYAQFLSNYSVS